MREISKKAGCSFFEFWARLLRRGTRAYFNTVFGDQLYGDPSSPAPQNRGDFNSVITR